MKHLSVFKICATIVAISFASLFVFFATNMVHTNVVNYASSLNFPFIFACFPHLFLAIEMVIFAFYKYRFSRLDEEYKNRHIFSYSLQFIVISSLSIVFTILSGTIAYNNFLIDNPYPYVLIISLVVHLIIIFFSSLSLVATLKNKDDFKKKEYKTSYIFKTAGLGILLFFAFNRLGAFINAFFYMEYHHFFFTLLFYLSLCVPLACLILMQLNNKMSKKFKIISWSILLAFSLITGLYTLITGINDPLLVSLVSASMAIERLATLPIDAILLYGVNFIIPIVYLLISIIKQEKKEL